MNFKIAYTTLTNLYGIEPTEEEFEELGLIAWDLIGNKKTKLYKATLPVDPITLTAELPCNANGFGEENIIVAVTHKFEYTIPNCKSIIENFIETRKPFANKLYLQGHYVNFEQVGNTLYLNRNYGTINVLYKGVILDEDGFPDINNKEALAIAHYIAYVIKQKDAWKSNNREVM